MGGSPMLGKRPAAGTPAAALRFSSICSQ